MQYSKFRKLYFDMDDGWDRCHVLVFSEENKIGCLLNYLDTLGRHFVHLGSDFIIVLYVWNSH